MSQLKSVKIAQPTYRELVPSTGEKVSIRPFKVGDEKVLLMASESKDPAQLVDSLKQVIGNCVEGVDVEKLASFDLEYLFLKLRAVSVGEMSEVGLACSHCEAQNKVEVNLSKIEVKKSDDHVDMIKVTDDLAFKMKYPDIIDVAKVDTDDIDSVIKLIANSIETVYHGEDAITIGAAEIDDLVGILNQLASADFQKLQGFFNSLPKVSEDVKFVCESCGENNKVTLEGLANFF